MNYLDYVKKKWEELLTRKVEEQEAAKQAGNSTGSTESSESGVEKDPLGLLEDFIEQQYKAPKVELAEIEEPPSYQRMEADVLSDEDIKKKAEGNLAGYADLSKNAIEEEIEALFKKLEGDKNAAKDAYSLADSELEDIYESAKERASGDMLKRGLARSSISANIIGGLEKELGAKKASALSNYVKAVSDIEAEIGGLEAKRQKALAGFNISYAAKLTEQINDLTKERENKLNEVLKYNNTLTEKEYNQRVDKEMKESDLYSERLSQAQKEKDLGLISKEQQANIYKRVYEKMDEYLASLSKKEAKAALDNPIFRENLSDYYYYKLLDTYGR